MQENAQEKTLAAHLAKARRELLEVAQGSAQQVRAGQDNPAIRRISANSFTMGSKDLGTANWSPFFHDWAAQYERLAELIETQKFSALAQVIQTGKLREASMRSGLHFAPQVVEHLRAVVGDLAEVCVPLEDATGPQAKAAPGRKPR